MCRVYDVGEEDDRLFLSMEYVDGEDLSILLRRIGRLPQEKALDIAGRMARWSPVSLRLAKEAVNAAFELPLKEGMVFEKERFLEAFASEDGREGVQAFMEKRKPEFKGR